jgi:hypothetical protein
MYLARVEDGRPVAVYPVDDRFVKLPNAGREKPRATIKTRRPKAWMFKADRSALVAKLSKPGAAAIARDPGAAIEAAMRVYSQYEDARRRRQKDIVKAHVDVLAKVIAANARANRKK